MIEVNTETLLQGWFVITLLLFIFQGMVSSYDCLPASTRCYKWILTLSWPFTIPFLMAGYFSRFFKTDEQVGDDNV